MTFQAKYAGRRVTGLEACSFNRGTTERKEPVTSVSVCRRMIRELEGASE